MAGGAGPLNKGCERRTWACRTFQGGGERHDRFGVVVGEGSSSDGSRVVSLGESVPECTHSCQSPRWRTMRISREHFGAPQLQDPTAKLDELEAVETNELEHLDVAEQDALDRSSQEIADRYAKRILAGDRSGEAARSRTREQGRGRRTPQGDRERLPSSATGRARVEQSTLVRVAALSTVARDATRVIR